MFRLKVVTREDQPRRKLFPRKQFSSRWCRTGHSQQLKVWSVQAMLTDGGSRERIADILTSLDRPRSASQIAIFHLVYNIVYRQNGPIINRLAGWHTSGMIIELTVNSLCWHLRSFAHFPTESNSTPSLVREMGVCRCRRTSWNSNPVMHYWLAAVRPTSKNWRFAMHGNSSSMMTALLWIWCFLSILALLKFA